MHLAILFHNIGGYHAARLRSAQEACALRGWKMTAVQSIATTSGHPWGDLTPKEITFPIKTLVPEKAVRFNGEKQLEKQAASLLPKCLDETAPDILVVPGWGDAVSHTALGWARPDVISIVMSESKADDARRYWLKERLKFQLYISKFDAALVGGEAHRDYLGALGFPRERIFLGYDVVDNEYFAAQAGRARVCADAARERQSQIPNRRFFLVVTRLIERKNVAGLLDAYIAYRRQIGAREAWDLVVCGSGEQEANIRRRVMEENLGANVHLPGFITYQEIGDWYGLASAFVHPALQEQWGLVVNEACASGLPILCSRKVGACPELVRDKQNGFTFDPNKPDEMTQALISVHQLDDKARRVMGEHSARIVAEFGVERFADGLMRAVDAAFAARGINGEIPPRALHGEANKQNSFLKQ
ncbi:MAG: glycosyltransferase family 4 protein [Pyrinomonadaceae bacterium MAG19_C2-C3]|nr:glycosyltransferase family 4 protein [Pyrinomonadaceae bacterium MAG19_C2-C3]